jgi:hypothetical protein
MLDPTLDIGDVPAGIALVPGAVELLSGRAKLYEQVAGQVLGIRLSPLFAPESDQVRFVASHDDAGVRATDEETAVTISRAFRSELGHSA